MEESNRLLSLQSCTPEQFQSGSESLEDSWRAAGLRSLEQCLMLMKNGGGSSNHKSADALISKEQKQMSKSSTALPSVLFICELSTEGAAHSQGGSSPSDNPFKIYHHRWNVLKIGHLLDSRWRSNSYLRLTITSDSGAEARAISRKIWPRTLKLQNATYWLLSEARMAGGTGQNVKRTGMW